MQIHSRINREFKKLLKECKKLPDDYDAVQAIIDALGRFDVDPAQWLKTIKEPYG